MDFFLVSVKVKKKIFKHYMLKLYKYFCSIPMSEPLLQRLKKLQVDIGRSGLHMQQVNSQ